jgi:glucose-1-phosphate cytidylyltransferase
LVAVPPAEKGKPKVKVVILAGGLGTRLSEETDLRPKPMVEIGGKPILWHIMKVYSHYGFNDFVICLGYKGYVIKEYFANYFLHHADVTIDLKKNGLEVHDCKAEPWKISLVDTGVNTMTGGRIKRVERYIGKEMFMLTYGDGVANINLRSLLRFHSKHGKYVTVTSVQPAGRFGTLTLGDRNHVTSFLEKPKGDGGWINGGFFVLGPQVFKYIKGDDTFWEREPLTNLARDNELVAYRHSGFWKAMDTLRDKHELDELCANGEAPWMIWNDV